MPQVELDTDKIQGVRLSELTPEQVEKLMRDAEEDALEELNARIDKQIGYEQEKLAWGRGFFSYEICDLSVYVRNQGEEDWVADANVMNYEDRRNCRIATPGSLIQDQTSFVFGSALRQMELNDEYEEWIAPNTLAVLSDILSFRGFNNAESRNNNVWFRYQGPEETRGYDVGIVAASPAEFEDVFGYDEDENKYAGLESVNQIQVEDDQINISDEVRAAVPRNSLISEDANDDIEGFQTNYYGNLPFEFNQIIDVDLYGGGGSRGVGERFFDDVLDPYSFID